jgi:hypothetical protein
MAASRMIDKPSTALYHIPSYPPLSPCETVVDGSKAPPNIIYGVKNLHAVETKNPY